MAWSISEKKRITVVVDGNDGTGKSTLVTSLKKLGYSVKDRGLPSLMTEGSELIVPSDEIYIILDVPISVSQDRLRAAGKDLEEKYHTLSDLEHYRKKFLEVSKLIPRCTVVNAKGSPEIVLNTVLIEIDRILREFNTV